MIEVIVNPLVVKQVPGANARLQQCARSGDEVPAKTTKNIWTIGDDAAFFGHPGLDMSQDISRVGRS